MPAIMIKRIEFSGTGLYISLEELHKTLPFIKEGGDLDFFIIEVRKEDGKLVKRFKPMKRVNIKIENYYDGREWLPCLNFSNEDVSRFNLGKDYKISILVTKYNDQPLFPFEIKPVGYNTENILESFSKLEKNLLTLVVEQEILNESVSYIYDSYVRLHENDIEGARTSIRKSLDILKDKFIPKIIVIEEVENFQEKLKKLINSLRGLVHYGGAHPGPAPRTTTEIIIIITTEIINYLARSIENGTIKVEENG